ncbi:Lrp/AsnC family transcriptional regulator [Aliiroseovarius sp. F47248L]|uniref:siroheme decarboxylase subunit beta n=1 Tax=Aliiroseovarius sp. F47248L TaxID=2926420 RepID=UPI001FF450DE|nr:Lrp/AsnC family transcriptional regulator [Aliiroseovarius sp. F47248L]MCK0140482.1 Lrp/AsnC family transcriptional regulator [Aliiroseovarius sp. F47248L]
MKDISNPIDRALLDDWQRDFPVVPRPFAELAHAAGTTEDDVLSRLSDMQENGTITRVGATCAPNTLSASTLAAVAAPEDRIEEVAAIINEDPGVNHSYEREDEWNIWFVATGPDRDAVNASLERISDRTGLRVLDLRLMQPFNIDLGFKMGGSDTPVMHAAPRALDMSAIREGDKDLMNILTKGMPLVAAPYAAIGDQLGRSEAEVLARVTALIKAGLLSRLGVIVRHRKLGWKSNAMVVWKVPEGRIYEAGTQLAALPGVTLCYERRPVADVWPYRLYCMIHAQSREAAMAVLENARTLPALENIEHKVLFSTRCFRQTGAMIAKEKEAAE